MRKTIALLLALVMLLSFAGCGANGAEGTVAGVEYYHYETDDFNRKCDKLEKLAETDRSDSVLKLYDSLYEECVEISSLYSVIYVKYSTDVTNEYYSDEQLYTYDILQESTDRLCGVCRSITRGPCAPEFRRHVGADAFREFEDYEVLTGKQKKLLSRIQKLVDRYNKTMESVSRHPYKYNSREWTVDSFFSEEGNRLAETDYAGYIEIYDNLMEHANGEAGKIFLKLVKLRTELAGTFGYDNYADFADEHEYNRDYAARDLESLYEDVREVSSAYYDNLYSSGGYSEPEVPDMSERKMLSLLQKYSSRLSPLAGDACSEMIEDKLYSIGDEDCRQDGAFTTYIPKTESPFISMTLDGERDFVVLSHEFGHFTEYSVSGGENILTDEDNIDLAEVASNGFEALMTHYYDEIFGKENTAEKYVSDELLLNVIDGCIYDEFQRLVYADPDMTLSEVNEAYAETYARYNTWLGEDDGYSWVFVSHNFESPMYYISYAVSGLAALQIWNMSHTDFSKAVDVWEVFIREGSCNRQYFQVVDKAGLERFTKPGAVKKICRRALNSTSPSLDEPAFVKTDQ
ncbi:MAG: hypothetical protein ACI4KL_00335 [Lentihominibacter sp.]